MRGNNRRNYNSGETVEMGTFIHTCDDLGIIKLTCPDIPYPNSPVLYKNEEIGKIEDVFGKLDDVHASIKLNDNIVEDQKFKSSVFKEVGDVYEGYVEKFIYKNKFKSRTEVEKNKKNSDSRGGKRLSDRNRGGKSFDKSGRGSRSYGRNSRSRSEDGSYNGRRNDNRRSFNGNAQGSNNRSRSNNNNYRR